MLQAVAKVNPNLITIPTNTLKALVVIPCPVLVPAVTGMIWTVSSQVTPNSGCTEFVPSINAVDVNGNFLGNMAYWEQKQVSIAKPGVFTATWVYIPKVPGQPVVDVDLGDGAGKYIGFCAEPIGGTGGFFSSILTILYGEVSFP